jgi:hypothetical protein
MNKFGLGTWEFAEIVQMIAAGIDDNKIAKETGVKHKIIQEVRANHAAGTN